MSNIVAGQAHNHNEIGDGEMAYNQYMVKRTG